MRNRAGIMQRSPAGTDEVICSNVTAIKKEVRTWFGKRRVPARGYVCLLPGNVRDRKEFSRTKFFDEPSVKNFSPDPAGNFPTGPCLKNSALENSFLSPIFPGRRQAYPSGQASRCPKPRPHLFFIAVTLLHMTSSVPAGER